MRLSPEEEAWAIRQQSEDDLGTALILYRQGKYGMAAFSSQQALEKAFKYVMMQYGLSRHYQRPLKWWGHRPQAKIIKLLEEHVGDSKIKSKIVDQFKSAANKNLPGVRKTFNNSDEAPVSDKGWWKISLEIELSAKEKKRARRYMRKKQNDLETDLAKIIDACLELIDEKNKRVFQLLDEIRTNLKVRQNTSKSNSIKSAVMAYSKMQQSIGNELRDLLSCVKMSKKDKELVGILAILPWIVTHGLTVLKISPHEQLSRYPEEIDGVISSSHYEEKPSNYTHSFKMWTKPPESYTTWEIGCRLYA